MHHHYVKVFIAKNEYMLHLRLFMQQGINIFVVVKGHLGEKSHLKMKIDIK